MSHNTAADPSVDAPDRTGNGDSGDVRVLTRSLRQESVEVPVTVRVEMTPRLIAQAFADMSDESQAQFFIDLAEIASKWGPNPYPQWYLIGRHLRTCECATDESRELVAAIARGIGDAS